MKFMNKSGLVLAFLLPLSVLAQSGTLWPRHTSQSLINAQSVYVTNTIGLTNLAFAGAGTNVSGTAYTNRNGTLVVTTGSSGTNYNLLGSANLWSLGDGSPAFGSTNAMTGVGAVYAVTPGYANVSVSLVGGSGANTACTFILSPSWDGTNVDTTGTADFQFAVTSTGATAINMATNAPMAKWIGARRVFVKSITHPDADASSQVIIKALKFNGFAPP